LFEDFDHLALKLSVYGGEDKYFKLSELFETSILFEYRWDIVLTLVTLIIIYLVIKFKRARTRRLRKLH
jgi:hypothetical protein